MTLTYKYNHDVIQISETIMDTDIEFDIKLLQEVNWAHMKEIQRTFDEDRVYTDVLFYVYENHHYRIIVRKDTYVDFILELLKHRLLESAEWI